MSACPPLTKIVARIEVRFGRRRVSTEEASPGFGLVLAGEKPGIESSSTGLRHARLVVLVHLDGAFYFRAPGERPRNLSRT